MTQKSETGGKRLKGIYLLWWRAYDWIYSAELRKRIAMDVEMIDAPLIESENWRQHREHLKQAEVIFSGWGMAKIDEEFLAAAPNLKLVLYGAGSVRGFYTPEMVARGVRLCSAWQANAVPVAEFTYANIIFALKRVFPVVDIMRKSRVWEKPFALPGAFGTTVGLVSLGAIGRMVARYLSAHDVKVVAYDPFADPVYAKELGVDLVDLKTVFAKSDVVSIHAPLLDSTRGMIGGDLLASMREGASLINTARGQLIREDELAAVFAKRSDLSAYLDVVAEEPLAKDSPLWDLPNVYLTPHIAGSMDNECQRMGWYMFDELHRYLRGETLKYEVTPEIYERMA